MKLISSFLSNRKFRVIVEGELSMPRDIQVGMPQGSVLAPILCSLCIDDTPQIPGVYLVLYTTDRKEGYVPRKLQRGLASMESWCERWNIKLNEDATQAIYFSHRRKPVKAFLTLKGRQVTFVNHVKYLGVIFDKQLHGDYI
jgi:hypothetical protein